MTVIALTSDFITDRLNKLPPASRKRAGYCDLLKELRRRELEFEAECRKVNAELCDDLERVLDDPEFQVTAGLF